MQGNIKHPLPPNGCVGILLAFYCISSFCFLMEIEHWRGPYFAYILSPDFKQGFKHSPSRSPSLISWPPADSKDYGTILNPHMSCCKSEENQSRSLEFLFLACVLQKDASKCLSALSADSNQYPWIWLNLATQENSREFTASRKIRTLLAGSVLILEPLSHTTRKRESGPDTQLMLVLIITIAICWRLTVGQGFDLVVSCPPPSLIVLNY